MQTKNIAIAEHITDRVILSKGFIRTLTSSGDQTVPLFKKELSLFYKQETYGPKHHSFQLACSLENSFIGHCYMQAYKNELQLTSNNISDHPGTFQWHMTPHTFDHNRINELNQISGYALFIEPGYRYNTEGSIYSGLGSLLLTSALLISEKTYPWLTRMRIDPGSNRLSYYEEKLHFKKPKNTFTMDKREEIVLKFSKVISSVERTVIIKKRTN